MKSDLPQMPPTMSADPVVYPSYPAEMEIEP